MEIKLLGHMPGDENFCDKCVPRGCSCTEEEKDELNRSQPCCEYNQINEYHHTDKSLLAFGWATYYKYNPRKRKS